jgi:hypothetical protein
MRSMGNLRKIVVGILALTILCFGGCGGTKILKETKDLELKNPLAASEDASLAASFDWVIVRDGPGTWARNADWDEYLLRVHNLSDDGLSIESVVIYDSLDFMITSNQSRKKLVKGSKAAAKRYKSEGLKVKAGLGGASLVAVGGASYVAGASLGLAVAYGTGASAAAGVVAVGAILAAPVLVVGGLVRGVNVSKVTNEIQSRNTDFPLILGAGDEAAVDIFFPLTPSPKKIEVNYSDANGAHQLIIDTVEVLDGLHLRAAEADDDSS